MPIDWTSVGIAFGSVIGVPGFVWGINSIINLDKQFNAHEKVDDARFKQIADTLTDLKRMGEAHDVKLDRAIERLPSRRGD